jgi:hypothetical protein
MAPCHGPSLGVQKQHTSQDRQYYVTRNAHTQLDSELQDWKILANERLHHTQQHLTNYSASDMKRWTIQHKKNTLHILQLAHRNYKQYMKDNSKFQTLIFQYFERPARMFCNPGAA